jgi:hypothetical protein
MFFMSVYLSLLSLVVSIYRTVVISFGRFLIGLFLSPIYRYQKNHLGLYQDGVRRSHKALSTDLSSIEDNYIEVSYLW